MTRDEAAEQPLRRRPGALVVEGLQAGLVLALADWLATGPWRAPLGLFVVVLAAGLAGGLLAGLVVAPSRRVGAAAALALAGALALQGAAIASKQLAGAPGPLAGVLALAAGTGLVALRGANGRHGALQPLAALALVPAGALAGTLLAPVAGGPVALLLGTALPLGALLLTRARGRAALVGTVAALLALSPLPVLLLDPAPPVHREDAPAGPAPAAGAPDVVLVVVDTLRADAVDWSPGNPSTPSLAALAKAGVRFDQAVASASWTLPSMASLMTGLLPSQHGAVDRTLRLPAEATTLAERFRAAGYRTAAFTGGAFVDPGYGLAQGFEHFDPRAEYHFRPLRVHVPLAWQVVKNRYLPQRWVLRWLHEFGGVGLLRERLLAWMDAGGDRLADRPLFLLVHSYQVHDYYLYHPDPDDRVLARWNGAPPTGPRLTVHPDELLGLPQDALAFFEEVYRARLSLVDRELGALLEQLRQRRAARPRVLALTSDHGEGFDAGRHRVHHGGRLHDDLLRVPLVLVEELRGGTAPSPLAPGRVVTEQVRQVDVAPTLLALAGLEPPQDLAGTSLLPALHGEAAFPAVAWAEEHLAGPRWLALRAPPWKLMDGPRGRERYDVEGDELEATSLPFEGVPTLERLWISFDERYPARVRAAARIDASVRHQLEHIGYGD